MSTMLTISKGKGKVNELFHVEDSEASATPERLVILILPDGNHVNRMIFSLDTAKQFKEKNLQGLHKNLSEFEVVLCKEKNPAENVVLQDDEDFSNNFYGFDHIEIRSIKQHKDTLTEMQSCIHFKYAQTV